MRVLVAEDDNVSAKILQKTLERFGHEVEVVRSGVEAWEACQKHSFPLVLSDWMMPGLEGPELCRLIRAREGGDYSYFIILTAKGQRADKLEALSAGADDFLSKPLDREELHARISVAERILHMQGKLREQNDLLDDQRSSLQDSNVRLKRQQAELSAALRAVETAHEQLAKLNAKLSALATTDALTGIPNHRAFQDRLSQLVAEAERGRPFAMAMVDVDNFKVFNDDFGHQAGDEVLVEVAQSLQSHVRKTDFVARYGGEEFCVLFTDVDEAQAAELCEKLRAGVEAVVVPYRKVTASFGVCGFEPTSQNAAELIHRADEALYAAKQSGRNRVARASEGKKRRIA